MELSIFLAKVIGVLFLVMGYATLVNKEAVKKGVVDLVTGPGTLLLFGILTLLFGTMIILTHNVWVASWPVAITIFGYLLFINGFIRIAYPDVARKMVKFFTGSEAFRTLFAVILIVGAGLSYYGFTAA